MFSIVSYIGNMSQTSFQKQNMHHSSEVGVAGSLCHVVIVFVFVSYHFILVSYSCFVSEITDFTPLITSFPVRVVLLYHS